MLLYIIRHADPIYNPDSLTELGRRQAEALARRLSTHGLDRIYSSSNVRARQTAQPACELLGLECQIEGWMSEDLAWKDFSCEAEDGSGRRGWVFQRQNTLVKYGGTGGPWYESPYFSKVNAQEGYRRIAACSDEFTARLGYTRDGGAYRVARASEERVAAFCHQGFGLIWLSYLLDISPLIFLTTFDMSHSGVTILDFVNYEDGRTAPKCLCLSDLSHIYQARLPLRYNRALDI